MKKLIAMTAATIVMSGAAHAAPVDLTGWIETGFKATTAQELGTSSPATIPSSRQRTANPLCFSIPAPILKVPRSLAQSK